METKIQRLMHNVSLAGQELSNEIRTLEPMPKGSIDIIMLFIALEIEFLKLQAELLPKEPVVGESVTVGKEVE